MRDFWDKTKRLSAHQPRRRTLGASPGKSSRVFGVLEASNLKPAPSNSSSLISLKRYDPRHETYLKLAPSLQILLLLLRGRAKVLACARFKHSGLSSGSLTFTANRSTVPFRSNLTYSQTAEPKVVPTLVCHRRWLNSANNRALGITFQEAAAQERCEFTP